MLPGGMSQISNHLAETLDVRRNHVVTKIEHRQDNCTVSYYEGNQANKIKTMDGSACLCTIPLGVLMGDGNQEGDITFEPELSAKKQVAIQTRGFGHQNFAMIQFDAPFWHDQDPGKTSWSWVNSRRQCDREIGMEFEYFDEFLDLSAFKQDNDHHVLASFWTSDKYWAESLSDGALKQKFVASLER